VAWSKKCDKEMKPDVQTRYTHAMTHTDNSDNMQLTWPAAAAAAAAATLHRVSRWCTIHSLQIRELLVRDTIESCWTGLSVGSVWYT